MELENDIYSVAAVGAVDLANRLAEENPESDIWEIADGMLAGAIQYWLYSRQPCEDPMCEDCAPLGSAELRMLELRKLIGQMAEESDYYHSPNDSNVGRA